MATRDEVEYQIAGLVQELEDGLRRLERAGVEAENPAAARYHTALYRRAFERDVRDLRRELDCRTDVHAVALAAMQAARSARIWPILQTARLSWRGPDNLNGVNQQKQATANEHRQRCLAIAQTLKRPTAAAIRRQYREQFDVEPPSTKTITRYLTSPKNK